MADRVLFLSWSSPIAGREERSIGVFNEALATTAASSRRGVSRAST